MYPSSMTKEREIIIIGGGPAGLSAALICGRARRRALLIDGGTPRNSAAPAMHSFVSRDGILPRDFRAAAHKELMPYKTVERAEGLVDTVQVADNGFNVTLSDGRAFRGRKVVLALGMVDIMPAIAGLGETWGKGVHHCPFCDGFEHQDQPWGALADDPAMLEHALFLRSWSSGMTIFTNGATYSEKELEPVETAGVRVVTTPIARVIGGNGHSLKGLELEDGRIDPIESLWIRPKQKQTPLAESLGLKLRDDGGIWRDEMGQTSQPGIHAAGDCASGPMQQAILAAADGARTVFPIVRELAKGPAQP